MVTFLITFLVIIGFLAAAIYFWQRPVSGDETPLLPPSRHPAGLFSDNGVEEKPAAEAQDLLRTALLQRQSALKMRAKEGDKSTLKEGSEIGDPDFYAELLDLLVIEADSEPKLLALISYVTRLSLPVNRKLAERCIQSWQSTPERNSTAKMLHVAALTDNAEIYNLAVDEAVRAWRQRRLTGMSGLELRAVLEGEFWILSSRTRNSGRGFLLKRTLANARRELDAVPNA